LLNPKREKSQEVLDRSSFTFLSEGVSFGARAPLPNHFDAAAEASLPDESQLAFSVTSAVQPSRVVAAFYDMDRSHVLGQGQYGTVYRAVERSSGEPVACKVLDKQKALFETQSDVAALLNEVRVLQGLKHPFVLTAKDVFLDSSSLYIVLPLCEGGDLFDRIVHKHVRGYPEPLAKQLLANVIDAVAFLHANGIVHRDLKVTVSLGPKGIVHRDLKVTVSLGPKGIVHRHLKVTVGLAEVSCSATSRC
jgi:hypothetical protein